MSEIDMYKAIDFKVLANEPEFHSTHSIELGELIMDGWDWGRFNYYICDDDLIDTRRRAWIRARLNYKIENRFFFRKLAESPGRFKLNITSHLTILMGKYARIYKALLDNFDIYEDGTGFVNTDNTVNTTGGDKYRKIDSEYPHSQVNIENDYLTNGEDYESTAHNENVGNTKVNSNKTKNKLDSIIEYLNNFDDVDRIIIKQLERHFSCIHIIDLGGTFYV